MIKQSSFLALARHPQSTVYHSVVLGEMHSCTLLLGSAYRSWPGCPKSATQLQPTVLLAIGVYSVGFKYETTMCASATTDRR